MTQFKNHLRFIVATALCLPFLLHLLGAMTAWAMGAAHLHCPDFIVTPVIYGGIVLGAGQMLALPFVLLASVSVVASWFQKGKTSAEIVFTSIYSIVMLLDIGLMVYCLVNPIVWRPSRC